MAMQISMCSGPIFLGLYLQIRCNFAFIQQVCNILAAICLAQQCGRSLRVERSPRSGLWFRVLCCAGTYPCSCAGCVTRLSCLLSAAPPAFIVPLRSREGASPKMSLNDTVVAAVPQLFTENHVSCYRRGSVCTHQKLAFTCHIARNLLW